MTDNKHRLGVRVNTSFDCNSIINPTLMDVQMKGWCWIYLTTLPIDTDIIAFDSN